MEKYKKTIQKILTALVVVAEIAKLFQDKEKTK